MEQWLNAREALHTFDKSTFLVDQPDAHLPFLSRFIESQLFTCMIDQKILAGDKNINIKIFDLRIHLLRDKYDESVVRSTSFEGCSTIEETEQILLKRLNNVDYRAPPPQPIDPNSEACTHFNPGHFPVLDRMILNREPAKNKRRGVRAWHRRERQAQHLEQLAFSPDQREKVLQEARLLALSHPKLADMSPSHMAKTNWKFVEQLLKECKTRSKRMLVQKMGSEAIELGHGEGSLVGVEENTLIASLCDLLERIWGHGLQRKQGKSALWSHLISYQEGLNEVLPGDTTGNPNYLSPAMAWGILRKRIDNLSSRALEMESAPSSPTHAPPSSRSFSTRSRSVERSSEKGSYYSDWKDWKSPRSNDSNISQTPGINPLPISVSFDMKNVLAMPEIKTQIGYARAWVRLSLEKKLLSRHLRELLSNTELLRSLYKRYAFLRSDDEKEQFLSYLLSLNAVDYYCFTNKYQSSIFPYRVIIFTSRKLNAATTSANAWVSIGGTLGHTSCIPVPRSQYEMTFQYKNLGLLTTLRIGHDNSGISPKWMVEHVLVRNEVTGHTWKFPCGRWLGRGIDDGSLERILVGEIVPAHITSEDLIESCKTPPRCRSPNVPGPRRSDTKFTPPQIQQLLGDAVNNIVKFFYKPERERGSLTLLLCGDLGLVHSLELVFSYGFKSTRLFGKNLYLWDYFEKSSTSF
ncbi:DENN domain-containing protein 5A [Armadillidium nasatum]|uniref:DENN domain-containing protein 5A n=1 Tax=Armadillidium nasatum TaxID=96803 RepID=A0A5N5TK77_9CRUS|nr:DENN domain-containing protein 5A [Armadillidium nasatum]